MFGWLRLPRWASHCGSGGNRMSVVTKEMQAIVHVLAHLVLDGWHLIHEVLGDIIGELLFEHMNESSIPFTISIVRRR